MAWKQQKTADKPWILTSIKIKNKIYNKFCRPRNETIKNELFIQFKKHRNLITTLTRKSTVSHFKAFFDENKRDSLKIWQAIKDLIKIKPTKPSQPKMLNFSKKLTTNNYTTATEFKTFFNIIAGTIDENLIPTSYHYQATTN